MMVWFHLVSWVIFFCLYQISVVQNQCVNNNLSLADEKESLPLLEYLQQLEYYTGLSKEKPAVQVNCPNQLCVVNPQGSAIWEARMNFYTPYVVNSSTDDGAWTLDGCLCHSDNNRTFQDCMEEVRRKMVEEIGTSLMADFKRTVENYNCKGYSENCLKIFEEN